MRRTLSILSLLAALPAALLAQGAGQGPVDSIAGLGAPRSADSLRRVIDQAGTDEAAARVAQDQARALKQRTEYLIDIRKTELDAIEKRMDLAKKDKRAEDRKALESEQKGLELRIRVLERWHDLHDAVASAAEAEREAARKSRDAAQAEQKFSDMRGARKPAVADSVAGTLLPDDALLSQARKVVEARRSEADARRQWWERLRDLADRQKELFEAQKAARDLPAPKTSP
jgi:hypothetical protein